MKEWTFLQRWRLTSSWGDSESSLSDRYMTIWGICATDICSSMVSSPQRRRTSSLTWGTALGLDIAGSTPPPPPPAVSRVSCTWRKKGIRTLGSSQHRNGFKTTHWDLSAQERFLPIYGQKCIQHVTVYAMRYVMYVNYNTLLYCLIELIIVSLQFFPHTTNSSGFQLQMIKFARTELHRKKNDHTIVRVQIIMTFLDWEYRLSVLHWFVLHKKDLCITQPTMQ